MGDVGEDVANDRLLSLCLRLETFGGIATELEDESKGRVQMLRPWESLIN
jgi:hypothetical protein